MIPRLLITAALALAPALSALVATTRGVSSQGTDPASLVQAYIRAVNSHNVDAVLAVYADDAVHEVIAPGADVYIGKAWIRQFYQQTAAFADFAWSEPLGERRLVSRTAFTSVRSRIKWNSGEEEGRQWTSGEPVVGE